MHIVAYFRNDVPVQVASTWEAWQQGFRKTLSALPLKCFSNLSMAQPLPGLSTMTFGLDHSLFGECSVLYVYNVQQCPWPLSTRCHEHHCPQSRQSKLSPNIDKCPLWGHITPLWEAQVRTQPLPRFSHLVGSLEPLIMFPASNVTTRPFKILNHIMLVPWSESSTGFPVCFEEKSLE
jgi:hypothetical protein